jgi:mersacidin/lichenicidin family type 2 lantibiotic
MNKLDVIRAWKDPEFRSRLSARELSSLPPHPAGTVELSDEQLARAAGDATRPGPITTAPTCTLYTFAGWRACCP